MAVGVVLEVAVAVGVAVGVAVAVGVDVGVTVAVAVAVGVDARAGASSSSRTQVSLLPPPWELLTTRLPLRRATRVRPPGMMITFSP